MQRLPQGKQILLLAVVLLFGAGCQSLYYEVSEKMGKHKREILVDRVRAAQQSQQETGEQFRSALEEYRSVVNVPGGTLQEKYDKLSAELERSEAQAEELTMRINRVEDVAEALFDEWEAELRQYSNAELRRNSERKLRETRDRYQDLIRAMRRAEDRVEPALQPFRDQVLYLKHNLNAQAIGALRGELDDVQDNVEELVRNLEQSVREADTFLRSLE